MRAEQCRTVKEAVASANGVNEARVTVKAFFRSMLAKVEGEALDVELYDLEMAYWKRASALSKPTGRKRKRKT